MQFTQPSILLPHSLLLPQLLMYMLCSRILEAPFLQYSSCVCSPASPLCSHSWIQRISQPQSNTTPSRRLGKQRECNTIIKPLRPLRKIIISFCNQQGLCEKWAGPNENDNGLALIGWTIHVSSLAILHILNTKISTLQLCVSSHQPRCTQ